MVFDSETCPVCLEDVGDGDKMFLDCEHMLCVGCAIQFVTNEIESCHMCRAPMSEGDTKTMWMHSLRARLALIRAFKVY